MSSSPVSSPEPRRRPKSLARRARDAGMNPNHWYPGGFSTEVKRGKTFATRFWGDDIALYRGDDGVAYALEDKCPHRGIKLSHGSVEDCKLVCLYHGWTFDPGGKLVGMKHDTFGKKLPVVTVRSYPTQERYGIVWIFPGDPDLADATPMPHIPHAEGPDRWASIHFAYTWKAHHSMVIDNLCNLTHLWVHGSWVPYGDTVLADSSAEGDRLTLSWDHDLRRDVLHPLTSPFFRKAKGRNDSATFQVYDYPYQSALSNDLVRSTNFMLPMDAEHTRVFSYQLWGAVPMLGVGPLKLPRALSQRVVMPVLKPIAKEIFRQDGFTVEEEQVAFQREPDRPIPEPNPMVKRFNELTVRKWDEYLEYKASGQQSEAQRAEQTRLKVL